MNLRVDRLGAAGPAYAALRLRKGLPPVKGAGYTVDPKAEGPVTVILRGRRYGALLEGGKPAPAVP